MNGRLREKTLNLFQYHEENQKNENQDPDSVH